MCNFQINVLVTMASGRNHRLTLIRSGPDRIGLRFGRRAGVLVYVCQEAGRSSLSGICGKGAETSARLADTATDAGGVWLTGRPEVQKKALRAERPPITVIFANGRALRRCNGRVSGAVAMNLRESRFRAFWKEG